MAYIPEIKKSLLIPSGSEMHLYVTITAKCNNNQHLLIPISSIKPNRYFDPTCVITSGEHRFINRQSYVEYRFADVKHEQHITTCADRMYYVPHDNVSDVLFSKMISGIDLSPHIKNYVKEYFRKWPNT
jgi:hypothetical protein